MLRTILNESFDIVAGSRYDESQAAPPFRQLMGLDRSLTSRLIKTHDYPESEAPAIYAVRDGRAAIVSYWHFHADFVAEVQMAEVIRGDVGYGSWSDHFREWSPETRPNTLLLKFEEFSANPEIAIEALAKFLNVRPMRPFSKTFDDLKVVNPNFFRAGNNEQNIQEMTGDDLSLFSELHGSLMKQLGYW